MKHRIAQIQNKNAKPLNICLANFIHSGVAFSDDKILGPSRLRISRAWTSVKPYGGMKKTFATNY
jgi:hypothetical protein